MRTSLFRIWSTVCFVFAPLLVACDPPKAAHNAKTCVDCRHRELCKKNQPPRSVDPAGLVTAQAGIDGRLSLPAGISRSSLFFDPDDRAGRPALGIVDYRTEQKADGLHVIAVDACDAWASIILPPPLPSAVAQLLPPKGIVSGPGPASISSPSLTGGAAGSALSGNSGRACSTCPGGVSGGSNAGPSSTHAGDEIDSPCKDGKCMPPAKTAELDDALPILKDKKQTAPPVREAAPPTDEKKTPQKDPDTLV